MRTSRLPDRTGPEHVLGKFTARLVVPEIAPKVAAIREMPGVSPWATPRGFIVATEGLPEIQVACVLISEVLPSEYVPIASNCRVPPTGTLLLAGATDREARVRGGGGAGAAATLIGLQYVRGRGVALIPKPCAAENVMVGVTITSGGESKFVRAAVATGPLMIQRALLSDRSWVKLSKSLVCAEAASGKKMKGAISIIAANSTDNSPFPFPSPQFFADIFPSSFPFFHHDLDIDRPNCILDPFMRYIKL
jgi:hypothetical protein